MGQQDRGQQGRRPHRRRPPRECSGGLGAHKWRDVIIDVVREGLGGPGVRTSARAIVPLRASHFTDCEASYRFRELREGLWGLGGYDVGEGQNGHDTTAPCPAGAAPAGARTRPRIINHFNYIMSFL